MTDEEEKLIPESWLAFALATIKFDTNSDKPNGWHWLLVVYHLHKNLHKLPYLNLAQIQDSVPDGHWLKGLSISAVPHELRLLLDDLLLKLGNPKKITEMDFSGLLFNEKVNFSNFIFPVSVLFAHANFSSRGVFNTAVFARNANFTNTTFSSSADFNGVLFYGVADFTNTTFSNDADFRITNFFSNVIFTNTTFSNEAKFSDAHFFNRANFNKVEFSNGADFCQAKFTGKAIFTNVVFSSKAIPANFTNAKFFNHAFFIKSKFHGKAFFENVIFSARAFFQEVRFCKFATFENTRFTGVAIFINTTFDEKAKFDRVKITGHTNFVSARFKKYAPSFHKSEMHSDISWDKDVKFWPPQTKRVSSSMRVIVRYNQRVYENLAFHMKGLDKYHDEHFFYREEMRCRRWLAGYPTKFFYWLYETFSDYGYGIERALFWWVVHILLGAIFIGANAEKVCNKSCDLAGNFVLDLAVSLANAHGVLFFSNGPLKDCYEAFAKNDIFNIIWGVQTIVGIPLLFMLLLTLRIRFRLK